MVIATFQEKDKAKKSWYFKEIFFVADIGMTVALNMSFLTLSNAEIYFANWELNWRLFITVEILLTIKRIELVERKEFAATAHGSNEKTFVVYVAISSFNPDIHPFRRA